MLTATRKKERAITFCAKILTTQTSQAAIAVQASHPAKNAQRHPPGATGAATISHAIREDRTTGAPGGSPAAPPPPLRPKMTPPDALPIPTVATVRWPVTCATGAAMTMPVMPLGATTDAPWV